MQSASLTHRMGSNIPTVFSWGSSIGLEGFMPSIMLLVVIIVVVVVIVVVISRIPSIIKLLFVVIVPRTTTNADGTSTSIIPGPVSTEKKAQKKNDVKARSMLLMALPNEHLLTFSQSKDAKTLFKAIEARFGESFDSIFNRLHSFVSQLAILDLDTMSFDDLYNNFKIVEQEVKRTVTTSSSSRSQNLAFLSSHGNTNEIDTTNIQVSIVSAPVNLEQIHKDDLEEIDLKWQLALLSMRARQYFQKTGKNITINGSDTVGYDKTKVLIGATWLMMRFQPTWLLWLSQTQRTGLGFASYNAVAPPPTGLFAHPTADLSNSGVKEFKQPEFEGYGPKAHKSVSVNTLNEINKDPDAPIIKDWVFDSDEDENFAPTAVLTKSEIVPINTAWQISSRAAAPISADRPINTAASKPIVNGKSVTSVVGKQGTNAVKSSACWVWRPKIKAVLKEVKLCIDLVMDTQVMKGTYDAKFLTAVGLSFYCWIQLCTTSIKLLLLGSVSAAVYIGLELKGYLINDGYADLVQHADKKELAIPGQMATGKEFSNPLMAGSFSKTISAKFWNTASSKTINFVKQIHAIVDGKAVVILESSVRSDLLFEDEDYITCLTNDEIFKNLTLMGYESLSTKLTFRKEEGDRVERAITTDVRLKTAQDSDTIFKTQTTTMSNVNIPQGMDIDGSPRHQDTMIGTSAQTLSERVLEQPSEPPPPEGHTSKSGKGYTPGSDDGRLKPEELMVLCTTLANRVTTLENKFSTTKAVYHKAFITLTKKVKKLETQLKQKRSRVVIHSLDEEEPSETVETSKDDDDATLTETLLNISWSSAKDKGKWIMQETEIPKKLKKKEMIQLSLDEELAQKLYAEELAKEATRQDQERYNFKKAMELQRQLDQRKEDVAKEAEVRKNMIMYLKNQGRYKQSHFKGIKYKDIRPIFERVWDQVHTFIPKDSEIEKEVMKRAGFDLQQGSSKKQRLDQQTEQTKETKEEVEAQGDSDQEIEEMKLYIRITPDDDISIDVILLATKPPMIVEYKIVNEGKISTYLIVRADGSTKRYTLMINLLENINKEDLKTFWKLVQDKHGDTRPEEGYERVLWRRSQSYV
nr:hypothetical protein [Tanacetum cinerariifolium]